jgi:heme exporter protein C
MEAKSPLLSILDGVTAVAFAVAVGMVFFYAPVEAVMGQVQKVFYFHVATGWVGMLSFLSAAVAGIAYLRTDKRYWDIVGLAAVEIGIVFIFITIITGSTWDPRLTTAAIMELIYAAYLILRQGIEDPDQRSRFGAVYAIMGFISVPLTFFSARMFRTIHPIVIGGNQLWGQAQFDMTPRMIQTFAFSLLAFTFVFIDFMWHRIRLGKLSDQVEQLRLKRAA